MTLATKLTPPLVSLLSLASLLLLACGRSENPAQVYETRGVVRGFSPDRSTIEIEHENIPGFMPSMTMPFVPRDPKAIVDLRSGDAIGFRLTVTQKDFWIDNVKKIPRADVQISEPKPRPTVSAATSSRLHEGDAMPEFSLIDQDGKRISLERLRGQPFVLTFVFTRCPLPNYCPRISNNFGELQSAIKKGSGELAQTRLLSITLDPEFDSPPVLKEYGKHLQVDPTIWSFATGDVKEIDALTRAFSVYRQTESGTLSHGLAAALINRDGKIERVWRGNAWTPSEVIEAIRAEAK